MRKKSYLIVLTLLFVCISAMLLSACGEKKVTDLMEHSYDAWKVTKAPTCAEPGIEKRVCVLCNAEETREIPRNNDHKYGGWSEIIAPTCTETGMAVRVCTLCGKEDTKEIIALGHDFGDEWVVDVESTCTTKGSKSHHCSRCGAKKDITEVAPNGHDFDKWNVIIENTCTSNGLQEHRCTVCGQVERATIPAAHDWETNYSIDRQPTCTVSGIKSIHCKRCGEVTAVESIEPRGHRFSSWNVVVAETCTSDGQENRICPDCGTEETRPILAAHKWDAVWTIDTAPTCSTEGTKSHHCSRCDAKKDITPIDPTGHTYGAWDVTEDETCTENGSRQRVCSVCSHVDEEVIQARHIWENEWTTDVAPTCVTAGMKSHHCSRCVAKKDETPIAANGHSYSAWTTTKEATCTASGLEKRVCSVCDESVVGHEEQREIAALGHSYSTDWSYDTVPTCTTAGKKSHHCIRCFVADETTAITVAALGHVDADRNGYCDICQEDLGVEKVDLYIDIDDQIGFVGDTAKSLTFNVRGTIDPQDENRLNIGVQASLLNMNVAGRYQIEVTHAANAYYNFNFNEAYYYVVTKGVAFEYDQTDDCYVVTGYTGTAQAVVFFDKYSDGVHGFKNVERIEHDVFRGTDITSITIPATVSYIGSCAFMECRGLTSIELSAGLEYVGSCAFSGCSALNSVTVGTTGWYAIDASNENAILNWNNKTGGVAVDLSDPAVNAGYFKVGYTGYVNSYWYRVTE